ncbi:GxxExxY protein [bacterium]|nr:GxxExxY protein [bacterium]
MNEEATEWPHADVTEQIIGAAFRVHNAIGSGHREAVYQKALASEMRTRGLDVSEQMVVPIFYQEEQVGVARVDYCVNMKVVVEIKSTEHFKIQDFRQLNGYLKALDMQIGLLVAFGHNRVKVKRVANLSRVSNL